MSLCPKRCARAPASAMSVWLMKRLCLGIATLALCVACSLGFPDLTSGLGDGGEAGAGGRDAGGGGAGGGGASGGGAGGGADAVDAGWWDSRYAYRRSLVIAAAVPLPAGYALPVSIDHAELVAAAKARADAEDVRVACASGGGVSERDRVLDTGSELRRKDTTLWWSLPAALAAGTWPGACFLYYGAPQETGAPKAPGSVYLFFDDFEAGDLARWETGGSRFAPSSGQAHRGLRSVTYAPEGAQVQLLMVKPALDVANVYVESWWLMSGPSITASHVARESSGNYYEATFDPLGWSIAAFTAGLYRQLSLTSRTAPFAQWIRVGFAIAGTGGRVFVGGTQVVPGQGWLELGPELWSGNVGLGKYRVPTDEGVWFDDFSARRYVDPEPTVALGPEEAR